jgi:hypothetical protein
VYRKLEETAMRNAWFGLMLRYLAIGALALA